MKPEIRAALQHLRDLLEPLTKDEVDDSEEILTELACESEAFVKAIDEVLG